jgi:hypothetical protein
VSQIESCYIHEFVVQHIGPIIYRNGLSKKKDGDGGKKRNFFPLKNDSTFLFILASHSPQH